MSRKTPRSLVLGAAVAAAAAVVLGLGAATHGFEPSLAEAPDSTSTPAPSSGPAAQTAGSRLRTSVLKLLVDHGSVAVVVRIANTDARRAMTDALIATDLVDRAGVVVGTSAAPGTDPLSVHIPYVGPRQSVLFVTDTIAAGAAPAAAHTSASGMFSARRPAHLAVDSARLRHSAFGWVVTATLHGSATGSARRVLVEAVVRNNRRIVAAGTAIASAPRRERRADVDIFLTGNARGGTPSVWIAGR